MFLPRRRCDTRYLWFHMLHTVGPFPPVLHTRQSFLSRPTNNKLVHPSINLLKVRTFCVSNAFLCSVHHPQVIPFSSFCNHGWPTCHFGVYFLVLVFLYSGGGAVFLSLFTFDTGRYLHILTLLLFELSEWKFTYRAVVVVDRDTDCSHFAAIRGSVDD